MSSSRAFAVAARLGLATSLTLFALIVIGSVVRSTGSGLACPDWPLCHGRLIPLFDFHVFIEWLHRALALLVSLLMSATVGWVLLRRALRPRLGLLAGLAVVLLLVQVLLGALTVWKLLHPSVVSSHLGVALLLFSTMLSLTLAAESQAERKPGREVGVGVGPFRPSGLLPLLALAATLTFAQAVLGGMVSTQHAGLACPDWPTCRGRWLPPFSPLEGLQMLHRYAAYLLTVVVAIAAIHARTAPDPGVRAAAMMGFLLVVGQLALGVTNVLLGTPPWLSAMHLGTAAALLGVLVIATHRAAEIPAAAARMVSATS